MAPARLRIVLGGYLRHLWHAPATATGFAALRVYIRPHCMKYRLSQSQAPFVFLYRFAPCGFTQHALCKVAFAGVGRTAVGAPRSLRAYAPPTARPGGCCGAVALVRRCAHRSGQWPAARPHQLAPAHPTGASPLRGFGPRAPVCPSAPQGGALSPAPRHAACRRHDGVVGAIV
jgi:hypothetical protein